MGRTGSEANTSYEVALTDLSLARFRHKIALLSGGLARRVGRGDCKSRFAWVERYGFAVPLHSADRSSQSGGGGCGLIAARVATLETGQPRHRGKNKLPKFRQQQFPSEAGQVRRGAR